MIDAVIKLGGRCLEEPAILSRLALEISELIHQGRWLVLVHGGGEQLDHHLAARGFPNEKKEGIRVTTPEMMPEIVAMLAGLLNKKLVLQFRRAGVKAVGLCGVDGGVLEAQPLSMHSFDPGRVGSVRGGNPALIENLAARGFLPVLASIAADSQDRFLNINADSFAAGLAKQLQAKRLILLSDVPGVLDRQGRRLERLSPVQVERFVADGTVHAGMIPKLRAALDAFEQAHCEVSLSSWNESGAIARILHGETSGTSIEAQA